MVILPKKLHDSTSLSCQSCISYHVCRLLKDTHKDLKQAPRVCSRLSSKLIELVVEYSHADDPIFILHSSGHITIILVYLYVFCNNHQKQYLTRDHKKSY